MYMPYTLHHEVCITFTHSHTHKREDKKFSRFRKARTLMGFHQARNTSVRFCAHTIFTFLYSRTHHIYMYAYIRSPTTFGLMRCESPSVLYCFETKNAITCSYVILYLAAISIKICRYRFGYSLCSITDMSHLCLYVTLQVRQVVVRRHGAPHVGQNGADCIWAMACCPQ